MTKIRFFLKGAHTMLDVIFVLIIWALLERSERLDGELQDAKGFSRNKFTPYSYKKHPRSGPTPKEKPKYPVGFASVIDDSKDEQ